jgi:ERCC4-related helicase
VEQRMVIKRRRVKQIQTLEVRLTEEAARLREQLRSLPRGRLRDAVERKALQIEAAYEVTELLRSTVSSKVETHRRKLTN